ncbi:hypothetical protein SLS62_005002 [Diatrype stigma]|uniref:Uncharacterized protein n=1 Tax=Diatrype stigma TaxID=117547 RepID=A0AAN9UTQ0_9PEZI
MAAGPSPASPTAATNIAATAEPSSQASGDSGAAATAATDTPVDADTGATPRTDILPASHWIAQEHNVRAKTQLQLCDLSTQNSLIPNDAQHEETMDLL